MKINNNNNEIGLCRDCGSLIHSTGNDSFEQVICDECYSGNVAKVDSQLVGTCGVLSSKGFDITSATTRKNYGGEYSTTIFMSQTPCYMPTPPPGFLVHIDHGCCYFLKKYSKNLSPEKLQLEIQETLYLLFKWAAYL
jgi:hypothetical protein